MLDTLRPIVFVTLAASLSACMGEAPPEGTGLATAEIQVVPSGVGCLRIVYRAPNATADTTRSFGVTPGNAATLDLGYLAAGAYAFRPSAYNVACASVAAATVPTWSGAPVDATIVSGNATTVAIRLRPNVTTTSTIDFVVPATAVFVSQLNDYYGSAQGYAAMQDGSVRAWGTNTYGQLGDGTVTTRLTPVTIPGLRDVSQIAASPNHACAVLLDGGLRCWGANNRGQLGDGSTTNRSSPVAVYLPSGARARSVTVGWGHSCATTATVPSVTWCWGAGTYGALGTGGAVDSPTPVAVALSFYPPTVGQDTLTSNAVANCGIHAEGYVTCWGEVSFSGLVYSGSGTYSSPTYSVFGSGFTDFRLGANFACALRPNGAVQCAGGNNYGQLGRGGVGEVSTTPEQVRLRGVTALRAGDQHACAIVSDRTVWCWGRGLSGELGDGSAETSGEPRQVLGITDAVSLSVGGMSSCAVRADGTVWCWGANQYGQLGDGSSSSRFVPARVAL